jgi:hypothetical protein
VDARGIRYRGVDSPQPFRAAKADYNASDGKRTWEQCLEDAGYERLLASFRSDELEIAIYAHTIESHSLVEICDVAGSLSEFFVAEQDDNAFFASWYMEFLRSVAWSEQAKSLAKIARTLVAFVRHGHGKETIDEDGMLSHEEIESVQERNRREAAAAQSHKRGSRDD